jgi:hypothetical protein
MAYCNFQRKLLACASRPRTAAVAACKSAFAVFDGRSLYGDCIFIRLLVQLGENVSLVDTVVIVDKNPGYLAAYASGNERDVPVHIGVIRRDSVEGQLDPRDAEFPDGR